MVMMKAEGGRLRSGQDMTQFLRLICATSVAESTLLKKLAGGRQKLIGTCLDIEGLRGRGAGDFYPRKGMFGGSVRVFDIQLLHAVALDLIEGFEYDVPKN